MNRRKFLLGSTAVLSGTGLVAGTEGFSGTGAHQEARIQVENDPDAYLGLVPDIGFGDVLVIDDCEREVGIELRNQTKEETITVTLDPVIEGNGVQLADSAPREETIELGTSATVTFEPTCEPGAAGTAATLAFEITASGNEEDDTLIEARRRIRLECSCGAQTGISFVALCGDIESVATFDVDAAEDRVSWEITGGELDRVVVYGGLGSYGYGKGPVFLTFETTEPSGTVQVGNEDQAVLKDNGTREPSCPCPGAAEGIKYEIADDGTVSATEDGCSGE